MIRVLAEKLLDEGLIAPIRAQALRTDNKYMSLFQKNPSSHPRWLKEQAQGFKNQPQIQPQGPLVDVLDI